MGGQVLCSCRGGMGSSGGVDGRASTLLLQRRHELKWRDRWESKYFALAEEAWGQVEG